MGKDWWKSTTIWGLIINVIIGMLAMTGVVTIDFTAEQQQDLAQKMVNLSAAVVDLIAWAMILFGRRRAKEPLSSKIIPRIGGTGQ